jgi:hypothetical protein
MGNPAHGSRRLALLRALRLCCAAAVVVTGGSRACIVGKRRALITTGWHPTGVAVMVAYACGRGLGGIGCCRHCGERQGAGKLCSVAIERRSISEVVLRTTRFLLKCEVPVPYITG